MSFRNVVGGSGPGSRHVAVAHPAANSTQCAGAGGRATDAKGMDKVPDRVQNERNTFLALPVEILLEIIFIVRDSYMYRAFRWICSATHVCRRLRTISLNCPMLWKIIPLLSRPSLVFAMIERSGKQPLTVAFDFHSLEEGTRRYTNYQRACEQASRRFRYLTISLSGAVQGSNAPWLFKAPMPLLSSLTIIGTLYIPLTLTAPVAHFPSLVTLHLQRDAFAWSDTIYDNLVKLTLSELPWRESTLQDFEEFLSRMRCLTTLDLRSVSFLETDFEVEQRISLPVKLTDLSVSCLIPSSEAFLNQVNPVSNLQRLLVCTDLDELDHYDLQEHSKVFRHCNFPASSGTRDVKIEMQIVESDEIRDLRFRVQRTLTPNDSSPETAPQWSRVESRFTSEVSLLRFNFELLPSDYFSLTELTIDTGTDYFYHYDRDDFHELFGKLPMLHTLRIHHMSFLDIFDILHNNPEFLPHLQNLVIPEESYIHDGPDAESAMLLEKWMEERKKLGCGKVTLDLYAGILRWLTP